MKISHGTIICGVALTRNRLQHAIYFCLRWRQLTEKHSKRSTRSKTRGPKDFVKTTCHSKIPASSPHSWIALFVVIPLRVIASRVEKPDQDDGAKNDHHYSAETGEGVFERRATGVRVLRNLAAGQTHYSQNKQYPTKDGQRLPFCRRVHHPNSIRLQRANYISLERSSVPEDATS